MKQFFIILIISLFSLSCERREIVVLNHQNEELKLKCDSLSDIITFLRKKPCLKQIKYYIIASEKALLENGVIMRVSGLSREMKICNKLNKSCFIAKHIDLIDTLVVVGKDVKVVGRFHPDSYTITGGGSKNRHLVIIKEKDIFWDDGSYLIISHK